MASKMRGRRPRSGEDRWITAIAPSIACVAFVTACTGSHVRATATDAGDAAPKSVQVTMNANDPSGSGTNTAETRLTLASVTASSFGRIFSRQVDGDLYAQPLVASGVAMPDGSKKDVVYVATSNDTVYAFDADDASASAPLWTATVGTPATMPNAFVGNVANAPAVVCKGTPRFINELGVTATPVIDLASKTLYVVALDVDSTTTIPNWPCIHTDPTQANYCETYTCSAPTFRYKLHALDMTTGKERSGSPVTVSGTVPGSGGGSTNGQLPFDAMTSLVRTSLLLTTAGKLYFASAGYSDRNTYHGWIFAYDAATLAKTGVFCDTSDGVSGGIWQSGRSLLADPDGAHVYVVTGNGTFDAQNGGHDYGDSVLKLTADLSEVTDYFSPFLSDYQGENFLADWDEDLGSAGATMIPGTTLLLASGKMGNGYLLDTANLGKWSPSGDAVVQRIRLAWQAGQTACVEAVPPAMVFSTPVVWTGADATGATHTHVYVWGTTDYLRDYALDANGQFPTKGVCFCPESWSFDYESKEYTVSAPDPACGLPESIGSAGDAAWAGGGALSVSSNGTQAGTGVLWATHATGGDPNRQSSPGVLEAYDATNVASPIWSSATNATRDGIGNWAKFTPPTVANGRVYVPTFSNQLLVYGLLDSE